MTFDISLYKNRDRVNLVEPGRLHPAVSFARTSPKWVLNNAGLLVSVAANQPAYEYDTSGNYRGFLLEGTRTNLLPNSLLAGGSSSTAPTNWSIGTSGSSAPVASSLGNADGAFAYQQTASAQRPFIAANSTVVNGSTYVLSMYIEAVSGGLLVSQILGVNSISASAWKMNDVVVTSGTVAAVGKLEATFVATSTSMSSRIGIGGNGNGTGSLTFSRPQLELGNFSSSTIPTSSTTAVTRTADVPIVNTLSAIGYSAAAGTMVFQVDKSSGNIAINNGGLFEFYQSSSQLIQVSTLSVGKLQGSILFGGNTRATSQPATIANPTKFAMGFDSTGDCAAASDGVALVTSGTLAPGTAPTLLRIGTTTAGGVFYGHIKSMAYYPRRLPMAELQRLTA